VHLVLFITLYLNGGLHAVSIGKPSERMSNFWFGFLKTEYEPNFGFLHIPSRQWCLQTSSVHLMSTGKPVVKDGI